MGENFRKLFLECVQDEKRVFEAHAPFFFTLVDSSWASEEARLAGLKEKKRAKASIEKSQKHDYEAYPKKTLPA